MSLAKRFPTLYFASSDDVDMLQLEENNIHELHRFICCSRAQEDGLGDASRDDFKHRHHLSLMDA